MKSPEQMLVIIKTGSTFPNIKLHSGDFEDWIINGFCSSSDAVSVFDIANNQVFPEASILSGIIITGSHSMVTDQEPWVRKLIAWIPQVVESNVPLLGICFGHQALAQAMGGVVDFHPGGREIGSAIINLTEEGKQDSLFKELPSSFIAHTTHAQTVIKLPESAKVLAKNDFEAHHAFRIGLNAWGLQFHPEFSAGIMNRYIDEQTTVIIKNGRDPKIIKDSVCNTPEANGLLKRFADLIRENGS